MMMRALPGPVPVRTRGISDHGGPPVTGTIVAIVLVVLVTFGSLFAWSAMAHIAAAVSATGQIGVESSRKDVQHLEGGIIREILVRDGETVDMGTPLVVLDDTRAGAELGVLHNEFIALSAAQARLTAELMGHDVVRFPADVVALAADYGASQHLATQRSLFEARRASLTNRLSINARRLQELRQQVVATEAQYAAVIEQRRLIEEELAGTRDLYREGYAPKTKVLALERTAAGLQGEAGALLGRLAELRESIQKINLEIVEVRNEFRNAAVEALEKTETRLKSVTEQLAAKRDTVRRTIVRAPEAGVVQDVQVHTIGGVVAPGYVLMQIVPQEDRLVADVKVRPEDIDVVFPGQAAEIHVVPYQAKRVSPVGGTVTYVSADILISEDPNQEPYYQARIEFDAGAFEAVRDASGVDMELYPGMPVRAMIILQERTVLDYLISPIYDVVEFGMREE